MFALDNIGLWVLFLIIAVLLIARIKLVKEQERFAVIMLGTFRGFKGPGLLYKLSGREVQWIRVSSGDRGEMVSPGVVRVNGADVPCATGSDLGPGTFVRVSGFDPAGINVVNDSDQRRAFVCEKCGHENRIS